MYYYDIPRSGRRFTTYPGRVLARKKFQRGVTSVVMTPVNTNAWR